MNLQTAVYNPRTGHLLSFDEGKTYGHHLIFIGTNSKKVIDAFCWWCSKINDLSNQADKPWDYVGKSPSTVKILADFDSFLIAYNFIEVARKCNPEPVKFKTVMQF